MCEGGKNVSLPSFFSVHTLFSTTFLKMFLFSSVKGTCGSEELLV